MSQVPSSFGVGSLGGVFSGIGGAVSDLYAAEGDRAEAQQYDLASQYASQEAVFTESSTRIKEMQADRQITMAIGGVKAGYAGSGLAESGSAGDVLRESAAQGALTTSAINYQGAETEAGFREQAQSYATMADAARNAAQGAQTGGLLQGLGAIANLATLPLSFIPGGNLISGALSLIQH